MLSVSGYLVALWVASNNYNGEKAEVFIFQTVGQPDDYTPPIDREPVWSNPSGGAYDYQLGRAPISNYYGEIPSNERPGIFLQPFHNRRRHG